MANKITKGREWKSNQMKMSERSQSSLSKIKVNKIQCNNCKDIIESKHRHDFVTCSCFEYKPDNKGCAVDGGHDYLRRIGLNWKELSEFY